MLRRHHYYRIGRTFLIAIAFVCVHDSVVAQRSSNSASRATSPYFDDGQEHSQWFHRIITGGRDVSADAVLRRHARAFHHLDNRSAFEVLSTPVWEQLGTSIDSVASGRPTCIAIDPTDTNILYLGEPQGGLWKSLDHGRTWVYLSQTWETNAVSQVMLDPRDHNTLYCATGDNSDPGFPFPEDTGVGIYKSQDGGKNWTELCSNAVIGQYCYQFNIDATDPNVMYWGGPNGFAKSSDGGKTWKALLRFGGAATFVVDPLNSLNIVVEEGQYFKRSTDGGISWNSIGSNLPWIIRASLAISPISPHTIYGSFYTNPPGCYFCVSTDDGATWTIRDSTDNWYFQGGYANATGVSPTDSNDIMVGGVSICRSTDGGRSFKSVSTNLNPGTSANYTHVDIHGFAFSKDGVYVLTDGGLFFSTDFGTTWQHYMNQNLATLLFVGLDAAPDLSYIAGGTQDNGEIVLHSGNSSYFDYKGGGDCGKTFISQIDSGRTGYTTVVYGNIFFKSTNFGVTWGLPRALNDTLYRNENLHGWKEFSVCESNPNVLALAGDNYVWYSSDGGDHFNTISDSGFIKQGCYTVDIAPGDPRVVYAASPYGKVYVKYHDNPWIISDLSLGYLNAILVDSLDPAHALALSVGGQQYPYQNADTGRILETKDTGKTWSRKDMDFPYATPLCIARALNGMLFVGTDVGVVMSTDGGTHWTPLSTGLPVVPVTAIQVRSNFLLIGTNGRGAFELDISNFLNSDSRVVTQGFQIRKDAPVLNMVIPNPLDRSDEGRIGFQLASYSATRLCIYDALGHEVRTIENAYLPTGSYERTFETNDLSPGTYYIALISAGHMVSQKFVIGK